MYIFLKALGVSALAVLILALFVSLILSFVDAGYRDGYCSALGGTTIGDSSDRICNVGGKVVEIP